MKHKQRWGRINWPWEYQVLILCIIVGTFIYVAQIDQKLRADITPENYDPFSYFVMNSWLFVMLFFYLVHWAISVMSPRYVSTPVWLIFAPPLIGLLCWRYVLAAYQRAGLEDAIFSGSFMEGLVIGLGLLGTALLMARVRMERVAFAYRDVEWEVDARPRSDQSLYRELLMRIQPWFYLPRRYRASEQGVVIEGWSFVIPIHFHDVRGVGARRKGDVAQSGFYVAKSIRDLVEIDVTHTKAPLMIAPENQPIFVEYCKKKLRLYQQSLQKKNTRGEAG